VRCVLPYGSGREHRVVCPGDVGFSAAFRGPIPAEEPDRTLSSSARCSSVRNSWLTYFGERCRGAAASAAVPMTPWREPDLQGIWIDETDTLSRR
jgi:hypothetical protein